MSKETDVNIIVSTDITSVKPAMDEVKRALGELTNGTSDAGESLRDTGKAVDDLRDELVDMASETLRQEGALGELVAGVLRFTPLIGGVAVTALASFAIAAGQGAQEIRALENTLTMTGDVLGATAADLSDLAAATAEASGLTRGSVAGAITEMVAAGNISVDVMGKAAEAAVLFEKNGGQAVDKTVQAFAKLGEDPVRASIELNRQTNYLTASVLAQIKSLEDQGRSTEAAKLAQEAYAEAVIPRLKTVGENLGHLESAWKFVRESAAKAWDTMLGAGRKATLKDLMAEVREDIERGNTEAYGGEDGARAALATLEAQAKALKESAEQSARKNAQEKARIDWMESGDKFLNRQAQKEKEIATARQQAAAAGVSDAQLRERIAAIEEKYATKSSGRSRQASDPSGEQWRLIGRELEQEMQMIERTKMAQNVMAQSVENLGRAYARRNAAAAESLLSDEERELAEALRKVSEEADKSRESLAKKAASMKDNALVQAEYKRALDEVNAKEAAQLATERANHSARLAMQQDWEGGAKRAFRNYAENANNVAQASEQAFGRAFSSMEDALVGFAMTGKLNFTNLANGIIADIIRIQARAAISGAASWLGGMFGFGGGSVDTSYTSGLGSAASMNTGGFDWTFSADGNVFSGAPGLHQYANTVQTSPKVFGFDRLHAFANGGVFAEKGPEAVMPLQRDAQGRLGVMAAGGNGGGSMRVEIINSGTPQQVDSAAVDFDLEGMVVSLFTSDVARQGPMAQAVETRYGLNRAAGAYA